MTESNLYIRLRELRDHVTLEGGGGGGANSNGVAAATVQVQTEG